MTESPIPLTDNEISSIIQVVSSDLSIAHSENDVNQALADLPRRELLLEQKLALAGERIGIRFRRISGTDRDFFGATIDQCPVVLGRGSTKHESAIVVLKRKSRSRFVIAIRGNKESVSKRWLSRQLRPNEEGEIEWIKAESILPAESGSSYNYRTGSIDRPLSPMRRLLGLWRPEVSDIRSIAVFSFFVGILSLTTPLAVEAVVNTIAFGKYLQPLIVLTTIVFVFLAFRAGLSVLNAVVVEIMQRRIFVRVVDDIALRLTRVPVAYLKRNHGPELVNRFFDIVTIQKVTAKLLLETLLLALQTVIGLTLLAVYHPFLLGYDIGLIFLMLVVLFMIGRGAMRTAQTESYAKYETAAWLQEIVRHPTTFKFNGGLLFALNRADELATRYVHSRKDHFQILVRQITFTFLTQAIAATALLGLGGWLVMEGQLTLGQLVAAELIVSVILSSFAKVGKDLEGLYDLLASVDKLGKLLDLPGEPADKLRLVTRQGPAEINLVDLKFLPTQPSTTLMIQPGSTVAFTGRSGAGKTKVLETIGGMHTPLDGYVLLNKFRVDLLGSASLQSKLSFVNDIEIFAGTVDENLRLGRSHIDSKWLNTIVERIGLHDTLTDLEKGFRTKLSVSGFPLSTGQAIRLVLARALITRPPALLIDNLLDRLADDDLADILERLTPFKSESTLIVATGRQAVIDWADEHVHLTTGDSR